MKSQEVLVNILSNAVKFTSPGGEIVLTAGQIEEKKDNAVVRFVIRDTGVGIDPEFLPHLFELFSQESTGTTALYGGSGLGLAISKSVVDLMDGRISVKSQKGQGTQFCVEVKLGVVQRSQADRSSEASDKTALRRDPQTLNFSGVRLLLAEDNAINTEVAVVLLRPRGLYRGYRGEWRTGAALYRTSRRSITPRF